MPSTNPEQLRHWGSPCLNPPLGLGLGMVYVIYAGLHSQFHYRHVKTLFQSKTKQKTLHKNPSLILSQGIRVESKCPWLRFLHHRHKSVFLVSFCHCRYLFFSFFFFSFCDFRNFKLFHVILPREFNKPKLKKTLEHKYFTLAHIQSYMRGS